MHSVALTDIPYTGFDYGEPTNSLFWVVLALWSLIITLVIMYNRAKIGRGVNALARVFMVQQPVPEPRFVHERIITPQEVATPHMSPRAYAPEPRVAVTQRVISEVGKLVAEELAESRAGDFVDEFTEEDFGTVDFDGVNPDDAWVPRPVSEVVRAYTEPTPQVLVPQPVAVPVTPPTPEPSIVTPPVLVEKPAEHYADTLTLTTVNGLPRMVLTREVVA